VTHGKDKRRRRLQRTHRNDAVRGEDRGLDRQEPERDREDATAFLYGWQEEDGVSRAVVQFQASGRPIRFMLDMPDPNDRTKTMDSQTPDYVAFDIETTGLDPNVDSVTSAAMFGERCAMVVDNSDEKAVIELIAQMFEHVGESTIVGWNSAVFDFPFLYARCRLLGLPPFFTLRHDPAIVPKYAPLPGFLGGYEVVISTGHGPVGHLDIAYRYRSWADEHGVKWALKPVAQAHGLTPIEVGRAHMERLSVAERVAYNLSDVEVTLALALLLERPGG